MAINRAASATDPNTATGKDSREEAAVATGSVEEKIVTTTIRYRFSDYCKMNETTDYFIEINHVAEEYSVHSSLCRVVIVC